jgi:cystathionine beta-lyase
MGWSWGGYESLVIPTYPERTRTVTRFDAAGPCLRFAIGLDDPDDLIADLEAGFARLGGARGADGQDQAASSSPR